jgi:hypothetical protein
VIAGAGFAAMAWELAKQRTRPPHRPFPHRIAAAQTWNGADAEYFRIIHITSASWPAFAGERSIGVCPRIKP